VDEITSIDVPEVYRMSDAVLDAAGRLERLAAGVESWQYAGKSAVAGSVTCDPATVEAAYHWEFTLGKLAEQVRLYGADLRQAATDYREADADAARRVRESGHPAFAPGGGAAPR
jgi:hypothetical protein